MENGSEKKIVFEMKMFVLYGFDSISKFILRCKLLIATYKIVCYTSTPLYFIWPIKYDFFLPIKYDFFFNSVIKSMLTGIIFAYFLTENIFWKGYLFSIWNVKFVNPTIRVF